MLHPILVMNSAIEDAPKGLALTALVEGVFGGTVKRPSPSQLDIISRCWVTILLDAAIDEGMFDALTKDGAVSYGSAQILLSEIHKATAQVYDAISTSEAQAALYDAAVEALRRSARQGLN